MGDYQRQSNEETTKSGGKGGGGWRRLFRAAPSSPGGNGGPSRQNNHHHRRSRSVGAPSFARSNSGNNAGGNNNDGSSPPSRTAPRAVVTPGYKPPPMPMAPGTRRTPTSHLDATPLQSNARISSRSSPTNDAEDAAAIELLSIRNIGDEGSRGGGGADDRPVDLPYRRRPADASLFDNTSLDDAATTSRDGASSPNANPASPSMSNVDNLVNDVIAPSHDENDDSGQVVATTRSRSSSGHISTFADVEAADTGGSTPGSATLPRHHLKSSSTSDSVSLTADLTTVDSGTRAGGRSVRSSYSRRHHRRSRKKSRGGGKKSSSHARESLAEEKLDTYSGVFLPCLAQIVGVIFFLRLPTITGQAGTIGATLIVLTCVISTFLTSL
eukprot:CAMPEP_0181087184 /NCGR_PEP_ID=MMETSP1071-20121207/6141_1 /TAXON_ID=35127 /ORGANISM="Thalassiosira sp., Strain NH16" /LENGTH=383 /DNA_ID=CAMNT_0023169063 /DNA_START=86 /DNA_END=1234 /DNA_ORIENTATION=-